MRSPFSNPQIMWLLLLAPTMLAQAPANQAAQPPVPYTSASELNLMLTQLEQASQAAQVDLAKLRIDRWKADSGTKRQAQENVESIQRNLQTALPGMLTELRTSPENLAITFKLYRNLDALFDVFGSVAEFAGAFGSRDELQSVQNDLNAIERSRHALADRIDSLAGAKESELTRLRTQLQQAQAAASPAKPPAKVVVDDTEPPKKTPSKKKPVPKLGTGTQKPSTGASPATQPPQ